MEQYKYSALVKLTEPVATGTDPPVLQAGARVAVRARHHETGTSKLFNGLIVMVQGSAQADHSIPLTLGVAGDDVPEYLDAGDSFALWRGHDIGRGVISRRLSWFAEAP